jgi:hypothetical protein
MQFAIVAITNGVTNFLDRPEVTATIYLHWYGEGRISGFYPPFSGIQLPFACKRLAAPPAQLRFPFRTIKEATPDQISMAGSNIFALSKRNGRGNDPLCFKRFANVPQRLHRNASAKHMREDHS